LIALGQGIKPLFRALAPCIYIFNLGYMFVYLSLFLYIFRNKTPKRCYNYTGVLGVLGVLGTPEFFFLEKSCLSGPALVGKKFLAIFSL
jgi:hypothetical protein